VWDGGKTAPTRRALQLPRRVECPPLRPGRLCFVKAAEHSCQSDKAGLDNLQMRVLIEHHWKGYAFCKTGSLIIRHPMFARNAALNPRGRVALCACWDKAACVLELWRHCGASIPVRKPMATSFEEEVQITFHGYVSRGCWGLECVPVCDCLTFVV